MNQEIALTPEPTLKKSGFVAARRQHGSLTAAWEKRALVWMAARMPRWVNSDHLTGLGLAALSAAGLGYWWSAANRWALLLVNMMLAVHWLGDSLDGTLARGRNQQRT